MSSCVRGLARPIGGPSRCCSCMGWLSGSCCLSAACMPRASSHCASGLPWHGGIPMQTARHRQLSSLSVGCTERAAHTWLGMTRHPARLCDCSSSMASSKPWTPACGNSLCHGCTRPQQRLSGHSQAVLHPHSQLAARSWEQGPATHLADRTVDSPSEHQPSIMTQ